MCLITFAYKSHPGYRLILAANRDEAYSRATRKAQFWTEEEYPDILAGKDLEAGGTWMGVHRNGTWGALTNYRDPEWKRVNPPTRGELVLDFLKERISAKDYIRQIKSKAQIYNGFNLLLDDGYELLHYSNHNDEMTRVEPGIHGLSNAVLDTSWPKLEQAKSDLEKAVSTIEIDKEQIFKLLQNDVLADDDKLPDTGIPYEWEKAVSSVFIKTENYGTRCSTILLAGNDGKIEFSERRFKAASNELLEESNYSYQAN